jgi:hypothetical protein
VPNIPECSCLLCCTNSYMPHAASSQQLVHFNNVCHNHKCSYRCAVKMHGSKCVSRPCVSLSRLSLSLSIHVMLQCLSAGVRRVVLNVHRCRPSILGSFGAIKLLQTCSDAMLRSHRCHTTDYAANMCLLLCQCDASSKDALNGAERGAL